MNKQFTALAALTRWAVAITIAASIGSALWFLTHSAERIYALTLALVQQNAVTCGCDTTLSLWSNPIGNIGTLIIAAAALYLLIGMVVHTTRILRNTKKRMNQLTINDAIEHNTHTITLVEEQIGVCTYRSQVYMNTSLYAQLDTGHIDAIIAHELHHSEKHDDLKRALLHAWAKTCFFIPGTHKLLQAFELSMEIAADAHALRTAQRSTLLDALHNVVTYSRNEQPQAVAPFSISETRLRVLLGERTATTPLAASTLAFLTLFFLNATAVNAAQHSWVDKYAHTTAPSMGACITLLEEAASSKELTPNQCPAEFQSTVPMSVE